METGQEETKVEGSLRERAAAALAEREAEVQASQERQVEFNRRYNRAALVHGLNKCGITPRPEQIHETPDGHYHAKIEGIEFMASRSDRGVLVRGLACPICGQETYDTAYSLMDVGDALARYDKPFPHMDCRAKVPQPKPEANAAPKPYEASQAEVGLLKAAADYVDERVLYLREAG